MDLIPRARGRDELRNKRLDEEVPYPTRAR